MAGYDLTFDTDGRVITDLGSVGDRPWQLENAANGKILIAAIKPTFTAGITLSNIVITQYNPDGSLDNGFGTGGKLDTGLVGFTSNGNIGSITTTSTGKIVVTGADANGIAVATRFLANGQLDTSFGTNGTYSTQNSDAIISIFTSVNPIDGSEGVLLTQANFSDKYEIFTSLDANGRIVPLSFNGNTSATPQRLNINILNGILASAAVNTADPNVQGVLSILGEPIVNSLRTQYIANNFAINGVVVGKNGDDSIIINFFGYQNPGTLSGYVAFEYHFKLDGTFDLNYGTNGLAILPFPADYRGIADFGIDQADRIVLAIYNAATDDVSVYCLNSSGQADATFGTNGKFTLPGVTAPDSIVVEIDSQNRILVSTKKTVESVFSVTRVNSNGTIDNTFGTNGKLQLPAEVNNSRLSAPTVILGADNRLFVGSDINGDILIAKYDIGDNTPLATTYAATVDKTTLVEGNSDSNPVVFTINRAGNTSGATSINYALAGTAINVSDYNIDATSVGTSLTGTINFAANETTKTIRINILGDVSIESDETVLLTLSTPSVTTPPSSITTSTATTTIQNDDVQSQPPPNNIPGVTLASNLFRTDNTFSGLGITPVSQKLTQSVSEIALFAVDDLTGKIGTLSPGQAGYLQAALGLAKPIFSTLAAPFFNNSKREINLDPNKTYQVVEIVNGSLLEAQQQLAAGQTPTNLLFSLPDASGNSPIKVTDSATGYKISVNNDDLVLDVSKLVGTAPDIPIGAKSQNLAEGRLIDLTDYAGENLQITITNQSSAAYTNKIGFYEVKDVAGTITINGKDLKPGDVGYAEGAVKNAILQSNKTDVKTDQDILGGKLYAPVVISQGDFSSFLASNPTNGGGGNVVHAYFNYIGANPDKVDHFRLLNNNTFGVEDLFGGGDRDYNDIIINMTFKVPGVSAA